MLQDLLSLSGFIDGTFIMDSDIKLHGLSIGRFTCKDLEVSESAVVQGNIECRDAVIFGKIIGNTIASGKVSLRNGASITGSIACRELEVEQGALLNCRMHCSKNFIYDNTPKEEILRNKERLVPTAKALLQKYLAR